LRRILALAALTTLGWHSPSAAQRDESWYHECAAKAAREAKGEAALRVLLRACDHQANERAAQERLRSIPDRCKPLSSVPPEISRRKRAPGEPKGLFDDWNDGWVITYGKSPREICVTECNGVGWWSRNFGECS